MAWVRSFTSDSWWNKEIPSSVPVDPHSATMITAQAKVCGVPVVGSPWGGWAMPWSEVRSKSAGKIATITDSTGLSMKLLIDPDVGSMTGDDAAIVFRDLVNKVEASTFETAAVYNRDGTINTSKPIRCKGFSVYYLGTNGLSRQVGGDKRNTGHRGGTPSASALHPDEIADGIRSRKKIALGQPADHPGPNFPYYGIESPRNGGIPEGAVIRRRDDSNNPVLHNAHVFGFLVGDTGQIGHATLKTVQAAEYDDAILNALDNETWAGWDVMQLGWR